MRKIFVLLAIATMMGLSGCATKPPKQQDNLCQIFEQNSKWYKNAVTMQKKWGTPIPLAMAIIKQESGFVHNAKPRRRYLLGIMPWRRPSSAYGYAQALDDTWKDFEKAAGKGSSRSNFSDVLQFVGWYTKGTQSKLRIPMADAYNHYLVYHEGRQGFARGYHKDKPQLLRVAKKVATQTAVYQSQLATCQAKLEKQRKRWFSFTN